MISSLGLGHPQPFFAPIAAVVSLSVSHVERSRRIVQMVLGVLIGIVLAEGLIAVIGRSTGALFLIVLVTMLVSLVVGWGFIGEGMMFVNQATASAILIVTIHHQGTGAERALDAVVGGGMALLVGLVLFPAAPLPQLRRAEREVLRTLAEALDLVAARVRRGEAIEPDWTVEIGYWIHGELGRLARTRASARLNVRVAPRRFRQRQEVEAEDRRIAQLDLLGNAVLSLVRATAADTTVVPDAMIGSVEALSASMARLARVAQPWPADVLAETGAVAAAAIGLLDPSHFTRTDLIAALLRSTGRDLLALAEPALPDSRT